MDWSNFTVRFGKFAYAAANELVNTIITIVILGSLGYLGLIWLFSYVGGEAWITIAEFTFLIVLSVVYWQLPIGVAGSFIEFMRGSDDPKKKSVWRLYLFIFIAAVIAGHSAIVLRSMGLQNFFPAVIVVLLVGIATASLSENSDLEKWLKLMFMFVLLVTAFGMSMSAYKHSQAPYQRKASELDAGAQERLGKSKELQLEYIERIMTCSATKGDVMKIEEGEPNAFRWNEQQLGAYRTFCSKARPIEKRNISPDDLKKYWPEEFAFWQDAKPGMFKKGGVGAGEVAGGVIAGHILWVLLFGGAGLGWYVFKDKDESKDDKKKAKSNAGLWILAIAALSGGGYYYYKDDPRANALVENVKDTAVNALPAPNIRANELPQGVRIDPMQSATDIASWTPVYIQHTPRVSMPQDQWNGQAVSFGANSFVGDKVELRITFDPKDPALDLVYDGYCKIITGHLVAQIPKACVGTWRDASGHNGGTFTLMWESLGRGYTINMYNTATVPDLNDVERWVINPPPQPVRKIVVHRR